MADFKVTQFDYLLEGDPKMVKVSETDAPEKVRYEGPYFYLDATVDYTIPSGETWNVGIVQSVDSNDLRHSYESGNYTQWEYPVPISDSISNTFPHYSTGRPNKTGRREQSGRGLRTLVGTGASQKAKFSMNDNLASNVQWWDPVPSGQGSYKAEFPHSLKRISRIQAFTTQLIAYQGKLEDKYKTLCEVKWCQHIIIDVDCSKVVGLRSTVSLGNQHTIQSQHKDGSGLKFHPACLVDANANQKQILVGYDSTGLKVKPKINW